MARVLTSILLTFSLVSTGAFSGCVEGDEHDESTEGEEWENAHAQEQEQTDSSCSGVRVPDKTGFQKRVALTFDDGPNLDTTPKVLDVLASRGIRATFLINGSRVTSDAHRAILARMVEAGHIVGNHTQNHKNATELSVTEFRAQVDKTDAVLRDAGIQPRYFRFPFGASNCGTANIVREEGYIVTGWHVDSADWCFAAGGGTCKKSTFAHVPDEHRSDMAALTLSQVRSTQGGIVLFHDIHANTVKNLAGILDTLSAEGFTFTNVDDTNAFPKLNGGAGGLSPFVGTACTDDAACGYDQGYCLAASTANGVCSRPCEGTCPDLDGHAPTFCAAINPSQGTCLPKAGPLNADCSSLPGAEARMLPRFIGSSSASPATATVCAPK